MPTLNIKDPEVYRLASELAERRRTSLTGAVREALDEALAREHRSAEERIQRLTEIAIRSAAKPAPFLTDVDLYDERGAAALIIDTSALVAILRREPEEDEFKALLGHHPGSLVSAGTMLETAVVLGPARHEDLDDVVTVGVLNVTAFDSQQARTAREAYARFGKGSGSRARLNFGDCMAYALAKVTGEPLLFKGDDFTHTDVLSAR